MRSSAVTSAETLATGAADATPSIPTMSSARSAGTWDSGETSTRSACESAMALALPVPACSVAMNTEMAVMKPTLIAMAMRVATNRLGWNLSSLSACRSIRPPPSP